MSRNTRSFASLRRLLALLHARNLEFVRDRKTMTWNLLMPFGIVFAFAFLLAGVAAYAGFARHQAPPAPRAG